MKNQSTVLKFFWYLLLASILSQVILFLGFINYDPIAF
jgi:hypothetical protein